MIPKALSVDNLVGMETSTLVSSLAGFPVEQTEDIVGFLAEDSGLSAAGDFGILGMLAGSWTSLVARY